MAQSVKKPPAMGETWVRSLGWEDPLEEDMATHSNILAWRIPMDQGAWRAAVHGVAGSEGTEQLSTAQHRECEGVETSETKAEWPDDEDLVNCN